MHLLDKIIAKRFSVSYLMISPFCHKLKVANVLGLLSSVSGGRVGSARSQPENHE